MTASSEHASALVFNALAESATEARCTRCGATEWVISLDEPIDELFVANYHCDECD
jgi:hypothetical protein